MERNKLEIVAVATWRQCLESAVFFSKKQTNKQNNRASATCPHLAGGPCHVRYRSINTKSSNRSICSGENEVSSKQKKTKENINLRGTELEMSFQFFEFSKETKPSTAKRTTRTCRVLTPGGRTKKQLLPPPQDGGGWKNGSEKKRCAPKRHAIDGYHYELKTRT